MPLPRTVRLTLLAAVLIVLASEFAGAAPAVDELVLPLLSRQAATAGNNTNIDGATNGGSASANDAAAAAGSSIDTGSGGARSSPTTQDGFVRLLSGVFFGALLDLICTGAFVTGCWVYFERFGARGSDRVLLQMAVALMAVLSMLNAAGLIHRLYALHVANFGAFTFPLLTVGWEISMNYTIAAIMAAISQSYFTHRSARAMRRPLLVYIPAGILIAYTLAGGVASSALIIKSGSAANVKGSALQSWQPHSAPWQWSVVFTTWLVSCTAVDLGLFFVLASQLGSMKSPSYHTRHAIARLLLLSFETCLLTTGFSLASMILMLRLPSDFFYQITVLPIGIVYGGSMLVTLLSRPSIARELAISETAGPERRCIDTAAASTAAPASLAKPLVKIMLKKEQRRQRQLGELSVHMTTEVHQTKSNAEDLPSCLLDHIIHEEEGYALPSRVVERKGSASSTGTTRLDHYVDAEKQDADSDEAAEAYAKVADSRSIRSAMPPFAPSFEVRDDDEDDEAPLAEPEPVHPYSARLPPPPPSSDGRRWARTPRGRVVPSLEP